MESFCESHTILPVQQNVHGCFDVEGIDLSSLSHLPFLIWSCFTLYVLIVLYVFRRDDLSLPSFQIVRASLPAQVTLSWEMKQFILVLSKALTMKMSFTLLDVLDMLSFVDSLRDPRIFKLFWLYVN